ncbi:MAG: D-alanine--D-alanine ligase [Holosporales bacterium]
MSKKRVAVIVGGLSAEREVSLTSGQGALKALQDQGYDAYLVDWTNDFDAFRAALTPKPDCAFLGAMHGRWGEDGCLQGLLEILQIPYTNSCVLASALAMDKAYSRQIFASAGLPIAKGMLAHKDQVMAGGVLPTPYVVKPLREGSSIGVVIVADESRDLAKCEETWKFGEMVVVEEYIPGKELSVAVMGDKALGVLELAPKVGFYDYAAKYQDGLTEHHMPARIPADVYEQAKMIALRAHQVLGCEGVSRADLRYDDTQGAPGRLVLLEVNTQPGLTPLSIVPEIANYNGISYGELCEWMVENARRLA